MRKLGSRLSLAKFCKRTSRLLDVHPCKFPCFWCRFLKRCAIDQFQELIKTLGAKRYIYIYSSDKRNKEEDISKFIITIAGVHKNKVGEYIEKNGGMCIFNENLIIPSYATGKLKHTYIDNEIISKN